MPSSRCLFFLGFHLDLTTETLWEGLQRLPVRPKAWALLRYLAENPHRLITQAELLAAIWQREYVSDGLLRGAIRELRRLLRDEAATPRCIETMSGRGYRFIAAVSATPPPLSVLEISPQFQPCTILTPEICPSGPTPAVRAEEYKLVTILCGALTEAPTLAVRLGPEGLYHLLDTVVALAQEVLHSYAGLLTLATSEGFTAVFGAPVAQEDHARRAVLAAFELRQRLHAAPALHAQLAGSVLPLSMGLHSGMAVVGRLGHDLQRISTPVGEPFYLATRLQQQAAPGSILLSATTYALVHAEVEAKPWGSLDIAEIPTPVPCYALQGLLQRHAGVTGRGLREQSPFVGRGRELALLQDHLAAAVAGQGQVVGLVGEPGMGKTRLLSEFCHRLAGQSVTVSVGQCLSYGQATPYLPVRDILRQLCGLVDGDETALHTAVLQQRLHASGVTAEDDMAFLCQILDLPVAPQSLTRLSPEARRSRTFALLRHLVLHAAQRQPLVLVMENLHWSDPTSEAWLASLVERLGDTMVMLLGTYRPGYQPAWGAHSAATQVALAPLPVQDSWAVVQAVLGSGDLSEARLQTLVARAAGNPFFLEELAWHTRDQGGTDTPDAVPETVYAVLAARMDRLPPAAKHLLQTAAVMGMQSAFPLLQAVTDLSATDLHTGLTHLQAAEFLYETRLFPEQEYTFKHALTHEVAYGSLLLEQRRRLHARIVEALEARTPARGAEQVERLAHHALRGEVWAKAVTYCQQAGTRANARAAFRESVVYYEQALQALAHLPEDGNTRVLAFTLRFALGNRLYATLGEYGRGLALLGEAEALARGLDDRTRLVQVLAMMGHARRLMGDLDGALAAGQQALTLAVEPGESALQVDAAYFLGQTYYASGDFSRAAELQRWNVEAADRESGTTMTNWRSQSRARLATTLGALGAFAEGRRYGEEALRLATLDGRGDRPLIAHGSLGELYLAQGDLEHAIQVLEQGLALCRASGNQPWLRRTAAGLGYASALQGRLAEGHALLEEAISEDIRTGGLFGHASRVAWLSEVCRLAGRHDEAWQYARQALDVARQQKACGEEALALHQLGVVYAHADPPDVEQAEARYQQALALAEALGMRPLVAHCHHGLGMLYAKTDQREQAGVELTMAIDLYRAMEMIFWLPQAEATLTQVKARWQGGDKAAL